jgi:hypothetical protein
MHQTNLANEVVQSYELDHFYHKGMYPLLAYSLFNLVPSDHTCNTTNKGQTEFDDEYYLNPHQGGFADMIRFRPIGMDTSYNVSQIQIEILETPGSDIYKRINGNNPPDVEQNNLGNLNIFKIRSKYSNSMHQARSILRTLHNENTYAKHRAKYHRAMSALDKSTSYIRWYEDEFNVHFKSTDFSEKAYSKFYRDIHDYYFDANQTIWNTYIRELSDTF